MPETMKEQHTSVKPRRKKTLQNKVKWIIGAGLLGHGSVMLSAREDIILQESTVTWDLSTGRYFTDTPTKTKRFLMVLHSIENCSAVRANLVVFVQVTVGHLCGLQLNELLPVAGVNVSVVGGG